MNRQQQKRAQQFRRRMRVRAKISGTSMRPRLSVTRSLKHIVCQLIDDASGVTVASASDRELTAKGTKTERAFAVGKLIAEKASKLSLTQVVFDRGSRAYHGRVKAVADGAREGGLVF